MNYRERLARLGLYNFETRIVELSSLLRHGDTELEAQENNTLAKLFDRLAGKSTVKDLDGAALGVYTPEFYFSLKSEDTFVVREQREGETVALLRHRWCWLSLRHSPFLFVC